MLKRQVVALVIALAGLTASFAQPGPSAAGPDQASFEYAWLVETVEAYYWFSPEFRVDSGLDATDFAEAISRAYGRTTLYSSTPPAFPTIQALFEAWQSIGAAGWQLVDVTESETSTTYYFMRSTR